VRKCLGIIKNCGNVTENKTVCCLLLVTTLQFKKFWTLAIFSNDFNKYWSLLMIFGSENLLAVYKCKHWRVFVDSLYQKLLILPGIQKFKYFEDI